MNKKTIILLIIVAIVFVAVALYFIPAITPVELIMDAVKIDKEGNEVGTVQIVMNGAKLDYLFQPSRIDISFHPFDDIVAISPVDNLQGRIESLPHRDYLFAWYSGVYKNTGYGFFAFLGFSSDMTRWILCNHDNKTYYVASVGNECTTAELVEYFAGLIP